MTESATTSATMTGAGESRPRSWRARRLRRFLAWSAAAAGLLLVVGLLSLTLGAITIGPVDALGGLLPSDSFARTVVWQIRLPRFLDGIMVGASLAVAGALLQVVTRNPLADPTILGVSPAAGLAVAVGLVAVPTIGQQSLTMVAILGGLVGAGVLLALAWQGAVTAIRLTLAGVAISAFFGAVIVGLLSSSRTFLQLSLGFLAGGLYGSDWRDAQAIAPVVLPALLVAFALGSRLNALALGDEMAAGLGVLTDRTRVFVLGIVGLLAGAAVAVAGLVSFVGLVSPHVARSFVGDDHRFLVPASALTGAILVTSADLIARLVIRPAEIPMGILTAAVGAPFLLYLVRFRR